MNELRLNRSPISLLMHLGSEHQLLSKLMLKLTSSPHPVEKPEPQKHSTQSRLYLNFAIN